MELFSPCDGDAGNEKCAQQNMEQHRSTVFDQRQRSIRSNNLLAALSTLSVAVRNCGRSLVSVV